MKVTFKKDKPETGLRSVGHTQGYDVKLKKKVFGRISAPTRLSRGYTIMFAIEKDEYNNDGNKNCPWMWIRHAEKFQDGESAKTWFQFNIDRIYGQYKLHYFED